MMLSAFRKEGAIMRNIAIRYIERRYFLWEIFTFADIFLPNDYRFTGPTRRFIISNTTFLCGYNFMLPKRSVPFSLGSFAFIALGGSHL